MSKGKSQQSPVEETLRKIADFYLEQAEKSGPDIKSAVSDMQTFWENVWDASFKAQRAMLEAMKVDTKWVDEVEKIVQNTSKAGKEVQEKFTEASTDATVNMAKNLRDRMNKE